MLIPNPEYIKELITIVKQSPYPSHMSMALDKIELDQAEVTLDFGPCFTSKI